MNKLLSFSPSAGHVARVSPVWSVHLKVGVVGVPACHSLFPEVRATHGTEMLGRAVLLSYVS